MVTRDIKLNSTIKVGITNFTIHPEVLGATVNFVHEGYEIKLCLPKECDDERATVSGRIIDSGAISRVEIMSLDIQVVTKGKVTVPVEMLSSNCNAYDLAGEALANELDETSA